MPLTSIGTCMHMYIAPAPISYINTYNKNLLLKQKQTKITIHLFFGGGDSTITNYKGHKRYVTGKLYIVGQHSINNICLGGKPMVGIAQLEKT